MAAKDQEFYSTYLKKLVDEDEAESDEINNDVIGSKTSSVDQDGDSDDTDVDNTGSIIMYADGNYYYQSSEKMVKVKSLTKVSQVPVKKVISAAVSQLNKNTNATQIASASLKKSIVVESTNRKLKLENDEKTADETINSEISNQEEVYEFVENEQDADDSKDITDPDCNSIVKTKNKKRIAATEQSFTCMICSYKTNKKFLLSRHLKTHSDERPYKCSVCERGFKSNIALLNHRNTHLGYKPHGCSSCDMAFTTSGELVRHVRYRHTRIKPHKCTECDYSSVEMSKLRRHIRCHTGERPYQCPHCTYASPDTFKLKRHMRIHTGEKPYECEICHARFTQSNSLKHHRLIHSVNDKPVFQCHLCPTTCGRKTDLRLHIKKLHTSDQPLPCKRCGKELPDRYSYKMHIKTHEGEKCYRCEYCPYASISKRHLESHVLIHLNAKPFICEICQSNFRQKSLLTRHMKIYHSNNYKQPQPRKKDHKCPHCNKMFAFNGNLIRHMEVHDPTSRLFEEKEKLRVGRLKRIKPDGTIETVPEASDLSKLFDGNAETEEQEQIDSVELQEEYEETEEYNEENIQYVYDEYEADEYEEQYEEEEYKPHLEGTSQEHPSIGVKQEETETIDIPQTTIKKSITVKGEEDEESKILSLEVQDGQEFMVIEVLPDDDDDDNDDDDDDDEGQLEEEQDVPQETSQAVKPKIIIKKANQSIAKEPPKQSQSLISDYFGFEVNTDEDDEEINGAIKLLEMIEHE